MNPPRRDLRYPASAALGQRFAALWLACGSICAHAGLSLDAATARDQPRVAAEPWNSLAGFALSEGVTLASTGARTGAPQLIASEFGAGGGVRFQRSLIETTPFRMSVGLALRDGVQPRLSLEGSALVRPLGEAGGESEFYASVQRRHWGPGWAGSLILDGAAPAVPALGWRRTAIQASTNPWLSWIGPWGADLFVGRLQGHREPERPHLIGMRLQLAPVEGLDVGLSRTMQWGGRGRDESLSSLANSLLGNDNVGFEGITAENEPGNQLAGVDLRWMLNRSSLTSIYTQLVGEDEAGHLPSRNMFLVGFDTRVPSGQGSLRLIVEWVDLLAGRISGDPRPNAAYRHSVYRQGYTQEGLVLGHPIGGDIRLGSMGFVYRDGALAAMFTAAVGRAEPSAQLFAPGRVFGANASLKFELDASHSIGAALASWQDRAGRRSSVQVWLNVRGR